MEKILADLKNTAKSAVKKSSELLEIGKLKLSLVDIRSEIEKAYTALGKALYDAEKSGSEDAEALQAMIYDIDELFEKLAKAEEQCAELKKVKKCKGCGAVCSENSNFCAVCGERFE